MRKPWKKLLGAVLAAVMLCLTTSAEGNTDGLYDVLPAEDGFTVNPVSESGVTVQIDGQDKTVYTGSEELTLSYEDAGEGCSYVVFVLEDSADSSKENLVYMDQNATGSFTIYPSSLQNGSYSIYMSGTDLDYGKVASFSCYQEEPAHRFTDVPKNAYYADAVSWAAGHGIVYGTSETEFSPNAPCTRAQAVTFLWRAAGSPKPSSSAMKFTDVKQGSYYYDAVLWAAETGVTAGVEETRFGPELSCTRCQIISFLHRWMGSETSTADMPFTDVPANSYFYNAVRWAAEKKIASGVTTTEFAPDQICTRAQIVSFLYRAKS